MSKKISKFAILTIILLFVLTIPTFARKATIDDIGKEIDRIQKQNNTTIGSYYIIGNYVFTSDYDLNTRDIMLAARSIETENEFNGNNKDTALKDMTIHEVIRTYDEKYKPTGWKIEDNYVGETKLEKNTKLNINYVDYNYFYEEVNTDEILKESVKNIDSTDYSAKFENGTLTYNIYDLNKKNSEIKGTGLVGTIRDIIKNENVKSLTVSYNGKDYVFDNSEMDEEKKESKAYEKLQELLGAIAGEGKNFNNMVQGDLVGKELTLTINIDETKARSQNYKTEEQYKIEFVYNAQATISNEFTDKDIKDLKDTFNYTPESTYSISGENGNYKVTGYVTEQDNITGFGEGHSKFFFAYTVKLDDDVDITKAKVKIPKGAEGTEGYNEGNFDETRTVTVLMEVTETDLQEENSKYRDVIIEVNGVPTRIRIDISELKLEKNSKSEIKKELPDTAKDAIKKTFEGWGFKPEDVENFETYKDGLTFETTDPHNVKVSGLLPLMKMSNKEGFGEEATKKDGYYFVYVIKTEKSVGKNGQEEGTYKDVTVKVPQNGEDGMKPTKELKQDSFDTDNEIAILMQLNPDADPRTFKVIVDMDGDKDGCAPYEITIDYSGIEFQARSVKTESKVITSKEDGDDLTETDKTTLGKEQWGYDLENAGEMELNGEKLTGKVKEQQLNETAGFGTDKGYYVALKIYGPTEKDAKGYANFEKDKWTIQLQDTTGKYMDPVTPSSEDYKNGFIVALIELKDEGQENKINYKIDWDGEENYFLPYEGTIDCTGLEFLTSHNITFDEGKDDENEIVTIWDEEKITNDLFPETNPSAEDAYHKLAEDKWIKEDGTEIANIEINKDSGDITLVPHWNIDVETFVSDVVKDLNSDDTTNSNKVSDKFDLNAKNNEITINVKKPNVPLTELAETSIPGTIAYVLQKGEIKDITLTVGEQNEIKIDTNYKAEGNKEYEEKSDKGLLTDEGKALKKEIIEGAKEAFDKELSNQEASATLDQVEYENKSFSLKIGDADKTVTLVDAKGTKLTDENKTYTFKFDSDFAVVKANNETGLGAEDIKSAVENENNYSTVYIDGDIEEENTISITADHNVTIESIKNASGVNAVSEDNTIISLSNEANKDYLIDVQEGTGTVTLSNLELKGGKKAEIKVENKAKVSVDNITLTKGEDNDETFEEGIFVTGGKFSGTNVTFEGETHDIPTVRVPKENKKSADIKLSNSTKKDDNYINVTIHNVRWENSKATTQNKNSYSDEFEHTYDTFYYINKENVKNYVIMGFMDDENSFTGGGWKIYEEEKDIIPIKYEDSEKTYTDSEEEPSKTLYFVGWGTSRTSAATRKYSDLILNWTGVKPKNGEWYFAYYVEYDHKITVDTNSLDKEGINQYKGKEYHTYKFADTSKEGMTVGQLKAIDSDFAKMWEDLEANKGPNQILIDGKEATDDTKISTDVTLTLGSPMVSVD